MMFIKNKIYVIGALLLCLSVNFAYAEDVSTPSYKYPDYASEYLGYDKFEKFNRKVFTFNSKLNKYAIRPVHVLWASILPQYAMDRIYSATVNIEYPIRLVSTLIQKDFKASKDETVRFITNTTIGLGGMYDPAKKFLKVEPVQENMEQALAKCNVKPGPYIVFPVLSSTCPRGLAGRLLDTSLNPSSYIATPVLAIVKAGLLVNRTSYMQPLIKMVESNYADTYDIARKAYGIENFIKTNNYDRQNIFETSEETVPEKTDDEIDLVKNIQLNDDIGIEEIQAENILDVSNAIPVENELDLKSERLETAILTATEMMQGGANIDNIILKSYSEENTPLLADLMLFDYNPQTPVIDAMRTALFDLPGVDDSIWNELSVWNRTFSKKIHTSSVNFIPERENYKFRYILQKDKSSPVAIIYPSIGEGIMSSHSVVLAKMFYEEGYSVIIQGSHFQWEYVRSMPENYYPGFPQQDAEYLKMATSKIIDKLQARYDCKFGNKVVIGTSFGAMMTLYLGAEESKKDTLNITKYISISPPIELIYAMTQIDKNTEEWNKNPANLKERVAQTAAKVLKLAQMVENDNLTLEALPFSDEEAKLITGFVMHQKLSDIIYTLENGSKSDTSEMYKTIYNMNYKDYAKKYLVGGEYKQLSDLNYITSLYPIADYLRNSNNYKIYHALDDYLVNQKQLKKLKVYSGKKTVLINNGSHLGFLYRQEFIDELKKDIALK